MDLSAERLERGGIFGERAQTLDCNLQRTRRKRRLDERRFSRQFCSQFSRRFSSRFSRRSSRHFSLTTPDRIPRGAEDLCEAPFAHLFEEGQIGRWDRADALGRRTDIKISADLMTFADIASLERRTDSIG